MDNSLHVLFDVSRLANTRLNHSGISRYTRELFTNLQSIDSITIMPTLNSLTDLNKGEFRNNLNGFSEYMGKTVILHDNAHVYTAGRKTIQFSPYDPLTLIDTLDLDARVMTVHDILHLTKPELYLAANASSQIERVLKSLLETDFVITVSEFTRMELLQHTHLPASHVLSIPLGVSAAYTPRSKADVATFCAELGVKPGEYFIFFAQQDPRKNFAATLQGINRYLVQNPKTKTKFVVVCSDVQTAGLHEQFEKSGMPEDDVLLLSSPRDDELALAYSGARGFLYPSLGEGFGLPPLEAMKCGCPVITSHLTSIPEVVRTAGLYVRPTNADMIASAINTLASDDNVFERLSKAALTESEHSTWLNTAKATADFFKRVTAKT